MRALPRFKGLSARPCRLGEEIPPGSALRAALRATFPDVESLGPFHSANLREAYPELDKGAGNDCPRRPSTSCPEWRLRRSFTPGSAIAHLEGVHQLKPEDVSRWLVAHGY